jgi:hypothetical protein
LTLAELLAPLSETEFLERLAEGTLSVQRCSGVNRFATVLSWSLLEQILQSGSVPLKHVRVTRERTPVPPILYSENNAPSVTRIRRLLDHGASVLVNSTEQHLPGVGLLAEQLSHRTQEQVHVVGVVSTGHEGALRLHYDPVDVVVLQVEGVKRWRIFDEPLVNPVRGMDTAPPTHDRVVFDDELRAGDLLFLPAGYWHQCENGPGRSVHAAITLEPLTTLHVVRALAQQLLAEESFRRPLARAGDAQSLSECESSLKARLIERIEQLSLADLLDEHQTSGSHAYDS